MIDTIEISCEAAFTTPGPHWIHHSRSRGWYRESGTYSLRVGPLTLKAFPEIAHPEQPELAAVRAARITAEVSLPSWRRGHNATLLTIPECVETLHDLHARIVHEAEYARGIPDYTAWEVDRLDLAHDWQVGEDRNAYVLDTLVGVKKRKAHSLHFYLEGGRQGGAGWEVRHPGWKQTLYDKQAEVGKKWPSRLAEIRRKIRQATEDGSKRWEHYRLDLEEIEQEAKGKLRFELSLGREKVATTLLALEGDPRPAPTVGRVIEHLVLHGGAKLGAVWADTTRDWGPLSDVQALALLKKKYRSGTRAVRLFGFWVMLKNWTEEVVKERCQLTDSTWYEWLRLLREAEVTVSDNWALQRLKIPMPADAAQE